MQYTPEFQNPGAVRHRARYINDFKRKVIAACVEPGVSTATVAQAFELNANLLRRWVVVSSQRSNSPKPQKVSKLVVARTNSAFLPVQFESAPITQADIRIELQQGTTTVRIQWPTGASSQCAAWLKEMLQ